MSGQEEPLTQLRDRLKRGRIEVRRPLGLIKSYGRGHGIEKEGREERQGMAAALLGLDS